MKLSVIYVNYRTSHCLQQSLPLLITSLKKNSSEIYIIDNNSWDDRLSALRQDYPMVNFLRNSHNLGFARACNTALRHCKGNYILLLNPDVYLQPTTLSSMLHYMSQHKDIGILAPQLRFQDGSLQHSCRRYPTPLVHFLNMLYPCARRVQHYLMKNIDHSSPQDIDWSLGAFLLVRREVLDKIGYLDERFFLYFEDVDLCRRAKKAGWRVVYYPKAVATHLYQRSSRLLFSKPFLHHVKSMYFYYKKHGIHNNR